MADGQTDADDVLKLFEVAASSSSPHVYKVRRRFRMDGWARNLVSFTYNSVTTVLFGDLGSMDLNANPKILPRAYMERMGLLSEDWFLDAELMIKARDLGLKVYELNVLDQMRSDGRSAVRASTLWEFAVNLLRHRFGSYRYRLVLPENKPEHAKEGLVSPGVSER